MQIGPVPLLTKIRSREPEAPFAEPYREARFGPAEVGTGLQGLPRLGRLLANTEELVDGVSTNGTLGEVLIRCNNVLYVRGIEEEE
ncbi:MAG: hypothetical protein BJ554DRAFT_7945 [Olpidium bornovanus]|uniref:Uncharacterized protein n=1 Tax=Olpidium bornovanus TaxID=278681 RepID=A0A8H7ZW27_9FUNG|nr:MAG: hypothetical protein BJ554DRAFT_7945 [Olpidium bornovanus]